MKLQNRKQLTFNNQVFVRLRDETQHEVLLHEIPSLMLSFTSAYYGVSILRSDFLMELKPSFGAGKIAGNAPKELEEESGEKLIPSENFLSEKENTKELKKGTNDTPSARE